MTPGDIVLTPSGRLARYEGGVLGVGAHFTYLDERGEPVWDGHDQCWDTVTIGSIRLLMSMQPEYSRV
jgi:hypothetical protein